MDAGTRGIALGFSPGRTEHLARQLKGIQGYGEFGNASAHAAGHLGKSTKAKATAKRKAAKQARKQQRGRR